MSTNLAVPTIVTLLHDLFTAVWIGGMFVLLWAVLPAARQVLGGGPETKRLVSAIQKRLSVVIYVSIVGLWGTGLLLSRRSGAGGMFHFETPYALALSLKHIAVLLMVALTLVRSLGGRKVESVLAAPKVQLALLVANLLLGILVLGLSGFTSVVGRLPPAG